MQALSINQNLRLSYNLLRITFGIVPIVAGLDKFTNLLTNWHLALPAWLAGLLPFSSAVFMMAIGIIEIAAGLLVLWRPLWGGMVVAVWLTLIAMVLLLGGNYLDVAVRDLVMAIAAFTLTRLSRVVPAVQPG